MEREGGKQTMTDLYNSRVELASFLELVKCELGVLVEIHITEDLVDSLQNQRQQSGQASPGAQGIYAHPFRLDCPISWYLPFCASTIRLIGLKKPQFKLSKIEIDTCK